jgi:hypothetical protein
MRLLYTDRMPDERRTRSHRMAVVSNNAAAASAVRPDRPARSASGWRGEREAARMQE